MPYKDPDPSDPNVLVGVVLPAETETMQDMAYAFAEEFALLGYDAEGLHRIFENPFYAGAHQAYRALGKEAVRTIIAECLAAWGQFRITVQDIQAVQTDEPPLPSSPATETASQSQKCPVGHSERSEESRFFERFHKADSSATPQNDIATQSPSTGEERGGDLNRTQQERGDG